VELLTVETTSSKLEGTGCLYINWRQKFGWKYDLKLSWPNGGDRLETTVISKITSNCFTVDRLRCDTEYQVSVWLHGQPETESDSITCKTNKISNQGNYSYNYNCLKLLGKLVGHSVESIHFSVPPTMCPYYQTFQIRSVELADFRES